MTGRRRWLALAAVLVLLGVLASRDFFDRDLIVAVSTEAPAPEVAEAMRPLMDEMSFSWEIRPYSDLGEMIEAVQEGAVDFAIRAEPSVPSAGVRTLAPLYPSIIHILHRVDRTPTNARDLVEGQKVYAGPPGGLARGALARLAADSGLDETQYELLEDPSAVEPDVYVIVGGLLTEEEVHDLQGYLLFSYGDPDALGTGTLAEGVAMRYRNAKPFVLPSGLYPGLADKPILTLAVRTIMIASAELPDPRAFFVAQALFENAQDLAAAYPLVTETLNSSFDPESLNLPIHPGARAYIDRNEPSFLERYAETFAFGITAIAAIISVIIWARRQRHQSRKDKLDVYYAKVLGLRSEMEGVQPSEVLQAMRKDLLNVQQEVFDLLIDERIEADTAFAVFLGLSNQVLNELDSRLAAAA